MCWISWKISCNIYLLYNVISPFIWCGWCRATTYYYIVLCILLYCIASISIFTLIFQGCLDEVSKHVTISQLFITIIVSAKATLIVSKPMRYIAQRLVNVFLLQDKPHITNMNYIILHFTSSGRVGVRARSHSPWLNVMQSIWATELSSQSQRANNFSKLW